MRLTACIVGFSLGVSASGSNPVLLKISKGPTLNNFPQTAFVALSESPPRLRIFQNFKGEVFEVATDTLFASPEGFAGRITRLSRVDSGYALRIRTKHFKVDTVVGDCACEKDYRRFHNREWHFRARDTVLQGLKATPWIRKRYPHAIGVYDSLYRATLGHRAGDLEPAAFREAHRPLFDSTVSHLRAWAWR